jgi:hypothetical protein
MKFLGVPLLDNRLRNIDSKPTKEKSGEKGWIQERKTCLIWEEADFS